MHTLPDHGDDGAASDEVDKTTEEGLGLQVGIVLLRLSAAALHQLQTNLGGKERSVHVIYAL